VRLSDLRLSDTESGDRTAHSERRHSLVARVRPPPTTCSAYALGIAATDNGRMSDAPEMPAEEVVRIVDWLEGHEATYQVNGGWGVDGLVGRRTRRHRDLDLLLDEEHVPEMLAWLVERGYRPVEDWLPVRIELAGAAGRVDVHPMRIDHAGSGIQQGLGHEVYVHAAADRTRGIIGGRDVVVARADRQRELRTGYRLRDVDRHDLAQLDQLQHGPPRCPSSTVASIDRIGTEDDG
jgi:lincosamide nucleotidyltransferase A/C/D/E